MIGQSVGSDASPLSCFLFRPRKSREKRRKRSHTNVSNASVTRTSRVSQTPLQTPIPYFHQWVPHGKKVLVAIACKTAYVCFHRRKWVHTRLSEKERTQRHTRRKRGRFGWGAIITLDTSYTFTNIPGPGIRTAYFAAFGAWSWVLPKNAKSLRDSDALMRVAVPRRRGPAGLRDLFRFCRNLWLYAPHSGLSMRARWGWYHYPRRALRTAEVLGARLSKRLICRFLRLLSSILCAVPFSANMQISLSAISVANAFPPPTTAGLCASSRIASNRTTTVSLGCMDSSSFGCLIVSDSSSTYTTRS